MEAVDPIGCDWPGGLPGEMLRANGLAAPGWNRA
jgi:hypothetical protein